MNATEPVVKPAKSGKLSFFSTAAGCASGFGELVEDAIDEAPGIVGAEFFREVDGLIDDDIGRELRAGHQFTGAEAQNGAINGIDALGGEVGDDFCKRFIHFGLVLENEIDE